jgi:hypothetical protein
LGAGGAAAAAGSVAMADLMAGTHLSGVAPEATTDSMIGVR